MQNTTSTGTFSVQQLADKSGNIIAPAQSSNGPGQIGKQHSRFAPGGQGDNIYHLLRAIRGGRPTLVGSISKGGDGIIDFMTGDLLYDFHDFDVLAGAAFAHNENRLGYDSYSACCQWTDATGNVWYCFGGWVKTPALLTATSDMTNKYSYVVATTDFVKWVIPLADYDTASAGSSSTWACEVSDLVPTPAGLLILRGDGSYHPGVYLWTGSATTNSATLIAGTASYNFYKGCIVNDYLVGVCLTSSTYATVSLADGLFTVASVGISSTRPSRAGGTWAVPGSFDGLGAIQNFGGYQWQGSCDGFYIGLYTDGNAPFIPCFVVPNIASADLLRVHGWRSPAKQIAGGIVWAANCDVSSSTAYDAVPSYLLYMTEGGKVKVLMQGAHFGAIEVFNDRLYFGVNSGYHGNNYTRIRNGNPMLMSMPLEQIINGAPPAITENFSYTYVAATGTFPSQSGGSGINGVIGGYPTLGYRGGVLRINSSVANVLTILTWAATRNSSGTFGVVCKAYAPIALQANVVQDIDLSEYIKSGDILGYYLSSNCALAGRVVIHPNPVEQYNATAGVNYMLVNGATANGNGTGIYFPKLNKVFGALLTGTGAVSATVTLRGSVDGVNYDQLGIMTLSGTTSVYLTQVNNGAYQYVRADITNLTGTSAAITVTVGA